MFAGPVALNGLQTVNVVYSTGIFNSKGFALWAINGLASTIAKQIVEASGLATLTVAGGDLMFSVNSAAGAGLGTYTNSSQQPFSVHDPGAAFISTADWTMNSNNAAFKVDPTVGGGATVLAATWH
jgi:hypothetical protein